MTPIPRPPESFVFVQGTENHEGTGQLVERKRLTSKIQENKKVHYDTRKKLEKAKRLELLRENYPTRRVNTLKEPAN